mmetsp:Transcript_61552/g.146853  ORF Transcript_61552/g.146853 Transcript_61552/m.146853 type:complete len:361 (+) Transcript_61552:178-1260(+)
MFNRLSELQAAANVDPSAIMVSESAGSGKTPLEKALAQDALIRTEFDGVREKQTQLKELVFKFRSEILPRQLQQLTVQFEGTEEVCQKQLSRCKGLLAGLRPSDDDAAGPVGQIRAQLEHRASNELMGLMRSYFEIHASFRDERRNRMQRQLHYAYPEATVADLKDAVEFPQVAERSLEMRLAGEAQGRSLNSVRKELDKNFGDTLKLEQGANEIKMMFFQVAELVDEQDEILDSIESSINQALEDTTEGAELLRKAQAAKDAADRNACLRCAFLPWWVRLLLLAALIFFAPMIWDFIYALIWTQVDPSSSGGSLIELAAEDGSDMEVSDWQRSSSARLRNKVFGGIGSPHNLHVAGDVF